ncbi:glutamine--fructose-6-phosphate transaminase (isomerizing) [Vagococcus xieshaowenii]|uniref:Glutamine--fructose-6-phosphate aminotransferase [isomerizing] n=1 Tax=Vagococcus xieshaowenii TaxID=2562451 RepID=A0AAJ5EGC8_9ENTE|nr:glutamine--fructose-6-phosphate transaminase (isomerizing) [Vagococcus xieshaowenii]QCA28347.1 glutamine--fructose-6-phosphate transaminase (isomerizing) [Vagococcus xieshaowenii]TFZ42265.1 glutamine--fructose-6-phosphate transaminase (isomerizing) [Vagococcus xieshaowenii]
MCGIVGLIGLENVTEGLVNGLSHLEYRGYDSAGVYVDTPGAMSFTVKTKGRINDLREEIEKTGDVTGFRGIGHTRWATHGKPKTENAHPHTSYNGRFVLVHNGVIENFKEIKDNYINDEWLQGETDTEMIVHLVAKIAEEENLSAKDAFKKALTIVEGSYAFALADKEEPEVLYVAKNKSPLLVASGEDFNGVCSDALALIELTNQFVEINDKEMVTVTKEGIMIEDLAGQVQERKAIEFSITANDLALGTYEHYMLKEIEEQPAVMRNILAHYVNEDDEVVVDDEIVEAFSKADRVYIIACGTSWNAGLVGKTIIETLAGIPTEVHLASEFGYNTPLLSEKPFFIYLSQSGETADSRQVLVKTNKLGYPALTVTNVAGSTLSREANYTMLLHAGPEIAVASTKAYTAQIAVLSILASVTGKNKGIEVAQNFDVKQELSLVANNMDSLLTDENKFPSLVHNLLAETRNAFYIGRGTDYSVSLEASLKLKEISYIQCEGFASGELKHGTIALIEEGTPVIALITADHTNLQTRSNIQEVKSRGAKTCIISMEDVAQEGDDVVLPHVHPLYTALVSVLPTQLIAYYATLERGLDVDKPRNLAKSVTVE